MTQESGPEAAIDTAERTITLPSGHHVTLGEWGSLTRGHKRAVLEHCPRREDGGTSAFETCTGLLTLLITYWDFDLPLPSAAPDALDRLSWADDGVLQSAVEPIRKALFRSASDEGAQADASTGAATVHTPSGAWIALRDWHELNRGDKRTVYSAIRPGDGTTAGHDLTTGLLSLLVTNWSYPLALPNAHGGEDSLEQLPWGDDLALQAGLAPARRALFPPALPKTPEEIKAQEGDPTSPTAGAGD